MDEEEPASEAMMEKLIAEEIVRKLVADFGLAPHPVRRGLAILASMTVNGRARRAASSRRPSAAR